MIRVVIDTNVFIRYLLKPNPVIRYLIEEMWLNDELLLVSAPELLAELAAVLQRDYIQALITPPEGELLLTVIRAKAEILPALSPIPTYTRDPKDDKFVACAIAGQVAYLITLDQDILVLQTLAGVTIVTTHDFVEQQAGKKVD